MVPQDLVISVVQWVVVPLVLLALWLYSIRLVGGAPDGSRRVSATAGFWAGMLVCAIFVVLRLPDLRTPANIRDLVSLTLTGIAVGAALGFLFLLIVRFVIRTPVVGVLTLLLCGASSIALVSYMLLPEMRDVMASSALGFGLGALLHLVFIPDSVAALR
jgi:hypothetical protein